MGDSYIYKNQKKIEMGIHHRYLCGSGFLGSCVMLLQGRRMEQVSLTTPKGIRLDLEVEEMDPGENSVSCGVRRMQARPGCDGRLMVYSQIRLPDADSGDAAVPVGIMCMKKTDYGCIYSEEWEWEG